MYQCSRAVGRALRRAYLEQVRAATLYSRFACGVRNPHLHGMFMRFAAEEQSGVQLLRGLMESREVAEPRLTLLTQLPAIVLGTIAYVRPWRSVLEFNLRRAENRLRRLEHAVDEADNSGDLDAARLLGLLREHAADQREWFANYLR